ncbi:hypothetical protein GUJ93_ZPchr0002g25201 [Zizania palustris]|uniref:Metallo-beta-lactamase domain-containing protein n=1 Tax=Zizania palustris TaxID=103762 RepID=A0A8J5RUX2_ZIZPA|nr:hypothetical protein GUJ93_ZPchr0002g25201 [Zizania palustris]
MAASSLFSLPSPLRLTHRLLAAPSSAPSSRLQTLAARRSAVSTGTASGGGGGRGGGGLLSVLDRAMADEEEYRRARAQVERKGVEVEGYAIDGVSVGGHETCVTVPSLNVAFDIGRGPLFAVNQDYLFITHAHLDHIGGLPMYVATRGLYNLKPPVVFVPPCIKDDVEELLQIHRRMSQVDLKIELVALDLGETYEIRNDLVARPFETHHTIPSQGYVIYSVRRKLKKQYAHLKGTQIMKMKQSGTEITDTILYPEVAFTGDTTSDFILNPRNADALRAKVLITEATFLDDQIDVDHAREHGHMHLSEVNDSLPVTLSLPCYYANQLLVQLCWLNEIFLYRIHFININPVCGL